jgi:6-phosphogluconolactonase
MSGQVIRTKKLVRDAANFLVQSAEEALNDHGQFRIALSGGNTPRPIYSEWARIGRDFPWQNLLVTFGDERCVPPGHQDSNYRMARESLLRPANIPDTSVLRMRGEIEPAAAADEYQDQLAGLARHDNEELFRHDLILLGIGDDGHTASLFPGTEAVEVKDRAVVANFVPKFNSWRLTMTYPIINHARCVCFLVNASKNPELIEQVIHGNEQYPAARVTPTSGDIIWMIGDAA